MGETTQKKDREQDREVAVSDIFIPVKNSFKYVSGRYLTVLAFAIFGAVIGLAYSLLSKPQYIATCSFVLDDGSKGGGLGQYAGLAAMAGIDLGGSNGIFSGDNILELYKSRSMIEKTLLSAADFNGKKELLIERYIAFNNLRDKWKANDHINSISFAGNSAQFDRVQDSIITDIADKFNKKLLSVDKPDKKLNIIVVKVISEDELFAKEFTVKLVEVVNDFYTETKTKKIAENVQILQRQADSLKTILNSSISAIASSIDATPNANPALVSLRVPSQKKQVDVQSNTVLYSEIVKNLEISKISLLQEAPLIQVIDQPVLPLQKDHVGKIKGAIIGFFVVGLATIFFLALKKLFTS